MLVEVGAARPDYLSISALFRTMGWRIVAIEPNPDFCSLHREKGYDVLQYACGNHDEDNVDFIVVDSHGTKYKDGTVSFESFSSLGIKDSYAQFKSNLDTKTIKVNLRRLDTILREHAADVKTIDILAVDVEGWELEVLQGLDMSRYQPTVMIIENLFNEETYRAYMTQIGYVLWRRIEPNDVYVRNEIITSPVEKFIMCLREVFVARQRKR